MTRIFPQSNGFRRFARLFGLLCLGLILGMGLGAATPPTAHAADDRLSVQHFRAPSDIRVLPDGWVEVRSEHFIFQSPPGLSGHIPQLQAVAEAERVELTDQLDPATLMKGLRPEAVRDQAGAAQAGASQAGATLAPYLVRLSNDDDSFRLAQPGLPPSWAAGVAYPAFDLMVLRLDRARAPFGEGSLQTVFRHELVHLILGDLFGERTPPRWFDEGLARMLAREASIEQWVLLSQAVLTERLFPFSTLENRFPSTSTGAELAYAQSREFLNYLIQQFGPEVIPGLISAMRDGLSLNEALWRRTGYGLRALEGQWQDQLDANFAWISALGGGMTLLWGMAGILLFVGFLRKRSQRKERHARWALEEALEYGPSSPEELEALMKATRLRVVPGALGAEALSKLPGFAGQGTTAQGFQSSPAGVRADGQPLRPEPGTPAPNLIDRIRPMILDDEPPLAVYNGKQVRPDRPLIQSPVGTDQDGMPLDDDDDELESEWTPEEIQHFAAIDFQDGLGDEFDEGLDPEDRPPPGGWLH